MKIFFSTDKSFVTKTRSSNIEWLRIIAMAMILFGHFSSHGFGGGGIYNNVTSDRWVSNLNQIWLVVTTTGNLGNCIFMLISGYFLCMSKGVKLKRLLSIIIEVFTYSLVLYIIYTLLFGESIFKIKDIIIALTPLIHKTNWYFSAYVLIYVFHPYINRLIEVLRKNELRILILFMLIFWSIIPTVFSVDFNRSDFLLFLMVYLIGAYIRLYPAEIILKYYKEVFLISLFIWVLISTMSLWHIPHIGVFLLFYMNGSPLVIIISVSFFLFFVNHNVRESRMVNYIAGCMGGVYLIHDNPYVRSILYSDLLHIENYEFSVYLIPISICFVFLTMTTCSLVEMLRKKGYEIVERIFFRL